MTELKTYWKELHILTTYCHTNLFFNNVNFENLIKARNDGFILNTISNIPVLSLELPNFIKNRMPRNIDFITYIKSTKGILETDHISIEVVEHELT